MLCESYFVRIPKRNKPLLNGLPLLVFFNHLLQFKLAATAA